MTTTSGRPRSRPRPPPRRSRLRLRPGPRRGARAPRGGRPGPWGGRRRAPHAGRASGSPSQRQVRSDDGATAGSQYGDTDRRPRRRAPACCPNPHPRPPFRRCPGRHQRSRGAGSVVRGHRDGHRRGAGMPGRVRQRLLGDPVRRDLHRGRQPRQLPGDDPHIRGPAPGVRARSSRAPARPSSSSAVGRSSCTMPSYVADHRPGQLRARPVACPPTARRRLPRSAIARSSSIPIAARPGPTPSWRSRRSRRRSSSRADTRALTRPAQLGVQTSAGQGESEGTGELGEHRPVGRGAAPRRADRRAARSSPSRRPAATRGTATPSGSFRPWTETIAPVASTTAAPGSRSVTATTRAASPSGVSEASSKRRTEGRERRGGVAPVAEQQVRQPPLHQVAHRRERHGDHGRADHRYVDDRDHAPDRRPAARLMRRRTPASGGRTSSISNNRWRSTQSDRDREQR